MFTSKLIIILTEIVILISFFIFHLFYYNKINKFYSVSQLFIILFFTFNNFIIINTKITNVPEHEPSMA